MHNGSAPILAIDIGNSTLHVGIVDSRSLRCSNRLDAPLFSLRHELPRLLDKTISSIDAAAAGGLRTVIAGGDRGTVLAVRSLLREFGLSNVTDLTWREGLPVTFHYKNPSRLGPDRIADALYAAAAYPTGNTVIIGVGTAVTVNALRSGSDFLGGVIFPGAAAQLRSLHEAAPVLPLLDLTGKPVPLPGASTEACMRAGVIHAVAGGINHVVKELRSVLGGECTVLSTGGGWDTVKQFVDFEFVGNPDMTLIGAGLFLSL
jgi:type III pantothenate kinase